MQLVWTCAGAICGWAGGGKARVQRRVPFRLAAANRAWRHGKVAAWACLIMSLTPGAMILMGAI
eukprot:14824778-Alexandrium_andersonii.AAC.1